MIVSSGEITFVIRDRATLKEIGRRLAEEDQKRGECSLGILTRIWHPKKGWLYIETAELLRRAGYEVRAGEGK
jgi:hypothetical protein